MILTGRSINAGYGRIQILFDVDFEFKERTIWAIIGPNGSGKSTLLKTIFGLTTIYSGSIKFGNEEIVGKAPHEIAKLGIVYVPQVDNIFYNLNVKENLTMAAYMLPKEEREEKLKEILDIFPVVKSSLDRKAGTLSGGERQMLAIAMALFRKPKLMLFDEPTAHLAPKIANEVLEKIIELKESLGITVVLVEQNAKKALEISDYALLMVSGRVKFNDKSSKLLEEPEIGKLYIGL